jgi:hypothetical protein
METKPPLYGLMARFDNPTDAVEAARRVYAEGYRKIDAFSPYPVEELSEAIGFHKNAMPLLVLLGGIVGGLAGYLLQYYTAAIDYPINVGGRPFHSWPSFIPITFELTILGASFAAVFGMLALNGLPQPYHSVFNAPNFDMATRDHFFVLIEASDPKFDYEATRRFLASLGPSEVSDVET